MLYTFTCPCFVETKDYVFEYTHTLTHIYIKMYYYCVIKFSVSCLTTLLDYSLLIGKIYNTNSFWKDFSIVNDSGFLTPETYNFREFP